ncbi:MAG: cobalamin B12-binding domain-containing protein [Acetobacteraceae bacterium]|nr:cobalamin B12-binding domain-containing protein [Acetobacteraceae bacterium]
MDDKPRQAAVHGRIARIARAIEAEVVPRLVGRGLAEGPQRPTAEEIERMAALAAADDVAAAIAFAEALVARGIPVPALLLHLLSPAAARLGEWWIEDRCSFVDVTLGLMHLQHVLQALSPLLLPDITAPPEARRILLLAAPGEQHLFGLSVVAEFFRRGGWEVASETPADTAEAARLVRQDWYTVAGLSAGTVERAAGLAPLIAAIRRASCNPAIAVLVGGAGFRARPELAREIGADGTAGDGEQAVRQAEALAALLVAGR